MENSQILCKIISYTGQNYEISIEKNEKIVDLKNQILEIDDEITDFKLIYNGRIINKEDITIASLIGEDNTNTVITFYMNASKVHGGCYKKYED